MRRRRLNWRLSFLKLLLIFGNPERTLLQDLVFITAACGDHEDTL